MEQMLDFWPHASYGGEEGPENLGAGVNDPGPFCDSMGETAGPGIVRAHPE